MSDSFECGQDLIDVTSLHRPNTRWSLTDAAGHTHRWHVEGEAEAAKTYSPGKHYVVPSLECVHDGWEYFEDGERLEITHLECRECRETIRPGYIADDTTQYIGGLRWFRINGESVSQDEFKRRMVAARLA